MVQMYFKLFSKVSFLIYKCALTERIYLALTPELMFFSSYILSISPNQ